MEEIHSWELPTFFIQVRSFYTPLKQQQQHLHQINKNHGSDYMQCILLI